MAPERSEGATKGLRVTKSLSSRRSRCLTYLDYTEQESHDKSSNAIISVEELAIDFLSKELLKFPWYPLGN